MMNRSSLSFRLSVYYALLFTAVGVSMPFWPLWLESQGLNAVDIGLVMACTYLIKAVIGPGIGQVVDLTGQRRRPMFWLALIACLAWACFNLTDGFWGILVVTLVAQAAWSGFMPVGEALSMAATTRAGLVYGRVRLWGSISFIAAALATGQLLGFISIQWINWIIAALLGLVTLSITRLPDTNSTAKRPAALPFADLFKNPLFWLFIGVTALNQASHTAYYALASLHWKAAGHSDLVIGLLWSEGVVAEILLFALSGALVARLGPRWLLLMAGAGGIIRWSVLGLSTDLGALVSVQFLHAATFGCAHLGAMYFITQLIPKGLTARAQGVYAALSLGLAPGLASPLAGQAFDDMGGSVFLIMAGFSTLSLALAVFLLRSK